ncbi:MAG: arginase family protein [Mycobacterium sp.]
MTPESTTTLRLLWPQWQGAGREMVASLTPGIPLEQARHGYVTGTAVLDAILPAHAGPTASVPVSFDDDGAHRDGIDSKSAVVTQLAAALAVIAEHDADRIVTFGGECSVSVAPFAALAAKYGEDLAIVWVDSHPDIGTPASAYAGYHAMAVAVLLGHGDAEIVDLLPATVAGSHVALAGLHSWTDDDIPNAAEWGLATFSPNGLRESTQPLLDWLASTGCHRVAIHLDVDVVDSNEEVLGLGAEPDGLTSAQVRRLIDDISSSADVVGFTIAEYIPRQVMALQRLVEGMPLL